MRKIIGFVLVFLLTTTLALAANYTTITDDTGKNKLQVGSDGSVTSAIKAGTAVVGKVGIDQTTSGTTNAVYPLATENHIGEIGGRTVMISAELTRVGGGDVNPYIANDCISNSVSSTTPVEIANFARVNAEGGYIVGARLTTDKKSITPRIRVHLYNANNATVSVDNAAWQDKYADISKRVGYFDLPAMSTGADTANSDMSRTLDFTLRIPFKCAADSRSLWYVLETLDAFTPASGQKFTLTLYGELN